MISTNLYLLANCLTFTYLRNKWTANVTCQEISIYFIVNSLYVNKLDSWAYNDREQSETWQSSWHSVVHYSTESGHSWYYSDLSSIQTVTEMGSLAAIVYSLMESALHTLPPVVWFGNTRIVNFIRCMIIVTCSVDGFIILSHKGYQLSHVV